MTGQLEGKEKLLMPIFFLDEWKLFLHRSDQVTGIYMTFANSHKVSVIICR